MDETIITLLQPRLIKFFNPVITVLVSQRQNLSERFHVVIHGTYWVPRIVIWKLLAPKPRLYGYLASRFQNSRNLVPKGPCRYLDPLGPKYIPHTYMDPLGVEQNLDRFRVQAGARPGAMWVPPYKHTTSLEV